MTPQFDNYLTSSFLLYLNKKLQDASGFTNYSGRLYPVTSKISGLYAYATPFRNLGMDISVTGMNVMSGVTVSGNFMPISSGSLYGINYSNGYAYFTQSVPANANLSGNYSVPEISLEITDQTEYKLLFETQYTTNPTYNITQTGIASDVKTSPIIFLRVKSSELEPYAVGGVDDNRVSYRAIVIANSSKQLASIVSVLKKTLYKTVPVYQTLSGFDSNGILTGNLFNYTGMNRQDTATLVMKARFIDVPNRGEFSSVPKNIGFVDFDLSTINSWR
jgi:hypothetical protein